MKPYLKPTLESISLPCADVLTASGETELFEMDENMVVRWKSLK
ncbi:MAG: hypothetical protein SOZ51_03470 [Eubacteriales bacterium]|nr:hypothetical protein [Eubacteriales bacterium]